MKEIIGVRFKKPGKIYFFDPKHKILNVGDHVIVETSMGEEYAEVVTANKKIPEEKLTSDLKPIIRIATKQDQIRNEENRKKEKEAFEICKKNIKKHKLEMNLTDVEYKFDHSKMIFYFTADGRIDFRDLVKDLAAVFRTRIELRQIGVRDEVRMIDGNGMCGRRLCCCSFLENFEAVSIKMAKEQNISLNPSKISGNCGRLMCCLKYEQNVYEEKIKRLPKIGAIVKTEDGTGEVTSVETLKEVLRVKYKDGDDTFFKKYSVNDVVVIKDAVEDEKLEVENEEDLKELENLERLEKVDQKNNSNNDGI